MKMKYAIYPALLAMALLLEVSAGAGAAKSGGGKDASSAAPAAAPAHSAQEDGLHAEGEKRFRSNCARCHAAPPKFAPRMMSTIVRHMRVRANITDQDMRLILRYMTE
jgi:mono/diheme cytochrome c family protein